MPLFGEHGEIFHFVRTLSRQRLEPNRKFAGVFDHAGRAAAQELVRFWKSLERAHGRGVLVGAGGQEHARPCRAGFHGRREFRLALQDGEIAPRDRRAGRDEGSEPTRPGKQGVDNRQAAK